LDVFRLLPIGEEGAWRVATQTHHARARTPRRAAKPSDRRTQCTATVLSPTTHGSWRLEGRAAERYARAVEPQAEKRAGSKAGERELEQWQSTAEKRAARDREYAVCRASDSTRL
jgi:hypothetical protein